jgi:hypothetical protein
MERVDMDQNKPTEREETLCAERHVQEDDIPDNSSNVIMTRRKVFALTGVVFATTLPHLRAFARPSTRQENKPAGGSSQGSDSQSTGQIMEKLSNYMSLAGEQPLPDEVAEKAKQHILDTFAAMISGSGLPPGRQALKFIHSFGGGKPVATVVASPVVCGPIEAALANGILAHSDETDDSHGPSRSHPGVSVIPAALAAGELFDVTGARFLRSVVLGYDVGTRVTMSMGGPGYEAATHRSTHGTVAVFGAGAAAGCVAGLNAFCSTTARSRYPDLVSGSVMTLIWKRASSSAGNRPLEQSPPRCSSGLDSRGSTTYSPVLRISSRHLRLETMV